MENERYIYDLLVEMNERLKGLEEKINNMDSLTKEKVTLEKLLAEGKPENQQEEIDFGMLMGKEFPNKEGSIQNLWNAALYNIEKKISKPSFDTWLKSTKAHSLTDNELIVSAQNEFARDWLEERYSQLITTILKEITGKDLSIKFRVLSQKG